MSDGTMITLPVLPLRDIVVFPHMIVPLFVGREKSIRALEAVMAEDKQIILVTQKEADIEEPDENGLYTTGTVGSILQLLKLPDGAVKVLVEGASVSPSILTPCTPDHGFLVVDADSGPEWPSGWRYRWSGTCNGSAVRPVYQIQQKGCLGSTECHRTGGRGG